MLGYIHIYIYIYIFFFLYYIVCIYIYINTKNLGKSGRNEQALLDITGELPDGNGSIYLLKSLLYSQDLYFSLRHISASDVFVGSDPEQSGHCSY